jgi:MFS family permease
LVQLYVILTFVQLDIGFTAWNQYQNELGLTVGQLNGATALNYTGLAVGSFLFIPLMHKYGRRPLYVFSTALQLAACAWLARAHTQTDMWMCNLLSGLGGAVCETIVQVTICDLYFVHQHAAMNALYLLFTSIGAFLGPVAAGYVVDSQGWRWMWWWCVILFAVNLLLVVFFFEESKYVGAIQTQQVREPAIEQETTKGATEHVDNRIQQLNSATDHNVITQSKSRSYIDTSIPIQSYGKRMALFTATNDSILRHMRDPVPLLFTFPAIAFTAVTVGSILAVFAILTSVQAIYLFAPPYNFSAKEVGLMNIAPFLGTIPGVFVGGYLNDKSIVLLSKRNFGVYEPEMRLWLALPCAILGPAGVLMLGVGLANVRRPHSGTQSKCSTVDANQPYSQGIAWPLLAVGFGIFGFTLTVVGSIALSYAMDCYHDVRNLLSCLFLVKVGMFNEEADNDLDCWECHDWHYLYSQYLVCRGALLAQPVD